MGNCYRLDRTGQQLGMDSTNLSSYELASLARQHIQLHICLSHTPGRTQESQVPLGIGGSQIHLINPSLCPVHPSSPLHTSAAR